jgi:hypothetical protein
MAIYSLVAIGRFGTVRQYLEGSTYILHFGGNGIGSIGVAVLFVNLQCVFHKGSNFNPKLVVSLEVSGDALSYEGYNPIAFLQHMWHPPVKGWFMVNLHKVCVFHSLNGVRIFKVLQAFPGG